MHINDEIKNLTDDGYSVRTTHSRAINLGGSGLTAPTLQVLVEIAPAGCTFESDRVVRGMGANELQAFQAAYRAMKRVA